MFYSFLYFCLIGGFGGRGGGGRGGGGGNCYNCGKYCVSISGENLNTICVLTFMMLGEGGHFARECPSGGGGGGGRNGGGGGYGGRRDDDRGRDRGGDDRGYPRGGFRRQVLRSLCCKLRCMAIHQIVM